jgi:hypothetical protein
LKREIPAAQSHNLAHDGVGAELARVRWVRDISDRCHGRDLELCGWWNPSVDWFASLSAREVACGQETSLSTAIVAAKIWDLVRVCFASLRDGVVMRTCCGGVVGRGCRYVGW